MVQTVSLGKCIAPLAGYRTMEVHPSLVIESIDGRRSAVFTITTITLLETTDVEPSLRPHIRFNLTWVSREEYETLGS